MRRAPPGRRTGRGTEAADPEVDFYVERGMGVGMGWPRARSDDPGYPNTVPKLGASHSTRIDDIQGVESHLFKAPKTAS